MTLQARHSYGWKRDSLDWRDRPFVSAVPAAALPAHIDLCAGLGPVLDQGDLGSCTANAISAALTYDRILQHKPDTKRVPSRLFIYFNERAKEGTIGQDAGAMIRDGVKSVKKLGACFEDGAAAWAYDIAKFAVRPPAECFADALHYQALSYLRVDNRSLTQMKACLAAGFPFVFGFTVFESFESDAVAKSGVMPMPKPHEQILGGHAVLAVGYDDERRAVLVRNSWGKGWGLPDKSGCFWMPYEFIANPQLANDFWTIRAVE